MKNNQNLKLLQVAGVVVALYGCGLARQAPIHSQPPIEAQLFMGGGFILWLYGALTRWFDKKD